MQFGDAKIIKGKRIIPFVIVQIIVQNLVTWTTVYQSIVDGTFLLYLEFAGTGWAGIEEPWAKWFTPIIAKVIWLYYSLPSSL